MLCASRPTGTLIDIFIASDVAGNVSYITFTKTDPTTLTYKP
jgi:hypothetical protein